MDCLRHARNLLAALLVVFGGGCQTDDSNFSRIINEPAPLAGSLRETFGVTALMPANLTPQFGFQYPQGRAEAAGTAALGTFNAMERATRPEDFDLGTETTRILFSAIISGAAAIFGSLFVGVPESEMRQAEAALKKALQDDPLEPGIIARLQEVARQRNCPRLVPLPEGFEPEFKAQGAKRFDYSTLKTSGIDSVLLIRVLSQHFGVAEGINPPMGYAAIADVVVIRTSDGTVLHSGYLDYRSRKHTFTEWAAKDARKFRGESRRAQKTFANVILDQLFETAEPAR